MGLWDPLNPRQLDILRRIADPTVPVGSGDPSLARTVYALRDRGLVTTPGHASGWHAEITEAGVFYLKHGFHPSRPPRTDDRGRRKAPARRQVHVAPEDLLGMVRTAGGSLTIPDPPPKVRAAWRRAIYAARRSEALGGAQLMYTGRDKGDIRIWLPSHAGPDTTLAETASRTAPAVHIPEVPVIVVPERLPAALHPVVVLVQDNPNLVQVTRMLLPRVLSILQAIATESQQRGYDLIVSTVRGRHRLSVDAGGFRCELRIRETNEKGKGQRPAVLTRCDRRPEPVPSGLLQLALGRRGSTWTDGKRAKIEDRLGEVLAALDQKVTAYRLRCARQQREEAERHDQWEHAMADARALFRFEYRRDYLLGQHNAWRLADSLRQFCAVMDAAITAANPESRQPATREWTTWLMRYADSIDPLQAPEIFASFTFDPASSPEDLEPYLDGWDPRGPDR